MGCIFASWRGIMERHHEDMVLFFLMWLRENQPGLGNQKSENRKDQAACKPDSVPIILGDGHSSGVCVAVYLLRLTRAVARKPACLAASAPIGLAPGGVCHAANVAIGAVRSYRTLSPLPGRARRFAFCGTFPRVTPAGCYPAPCFRGVRTFLPMNGAAIRPPDH